MGKRYEPSYINKESLKTPGPDYEIKSRLGRDSPGKTIGQKLPAKYNANPGPGEYDNTFTPVKSNAPKYSMGNKSTAHYDNPRDKLLVPGPGNYEPHKPGHR
jgi:hypothetical protein